MKTIKDVEGQVEARVADVLRELDLLPAGFSCTVRLHGKSKDKKRNASFDKNWSPETDTIYISFYPESGTLTPSHPAAQIALAVPTSLTERHSTSDRISDLIRALDRAESRPGYDFVALKWFRDVALQAEKYEWAAPDSVRRDILREAIDKRLILTSKVPNPKSPQFPVTSIRLNRLMPKVIAVLGKGDRGAMDFQPVPIRGEGLSATVLRDRH